MAEGIDIAKLGRLVRNKRKEVGLSLRELADQTKLKIPTISRIERGASKDIDSYTLLALSQWLKRDPQSLRYDKPTPVIRGGKTVEETPDILEVYLRADKNLDPNTAQALSKLFRAAYGMALRKHDRS